jgi:probable rRNA maturation factor
MAISFLNRQKFIKLNLRQIRLNASRIMSLLNCETKEVTVLFVDDEEIHEINSTYLKRDHPTNVISFPMNEGEFSQLNPHVLGDIIISVETASRDAATGDLPIEDEIDFLFIHGLLHLLGYDHERLDSKAEVMEEKQRQIFYLMKGYKIA